MIRGTGSTYCIGEYQTSYVFSTRVYYVLVEFIIMPMKCSGEHNEDISFGKELIMGYHIAFEQFILANYQIVIVSGI